MLRETTRHASSPVIIRTLSLQYHFCCSSPVQLVLIQTNQVYFLTPYLRCILILFSRLRMDIASQLLAVDFLQQHLLAIVVASAYTIRWLHICAVITKPIETSFLLVKSRRLRFAKSSSVPILLSDLPNSMDLNRFR